MLLLGIVFILAGALLITASAIGIAGIVAGILICATHDGWWGKGTAIIAALLLFIGFIWWLDQTSPPPDRAT